jgi:hypothetical protein
MAAARASAGTELPANAAWDAEARIDADVAFLTSLRARPGLAPVEARAGVGRGDSSSSSGVGGGPWGLGPEHLRVAVLWSAPAEATQAPPPRTRARGGLHQPSSSLNGSSRSGGSSSSSSGGGGGFEAEMAPLGAPPLDEQCMATWLEVDPKGPPPRLYFRVFEPALVEGYEIRPSAEPEEEEYEHEDDETEPERAAELAAAGAASSGRDRPFAPNARACVPRWGVRAWSVEAAATAAETREASDGEETGGGRPAAASVSEGAPRSPVFTGPLAALRFDGGHLAARAAAADAPPTGEATPPGRGGGASGPRSYVGAVRYLSPAQVRLGLEARLAKHGGGECLQRDAVRRDAPELFWNLWWLCARLGLPLPLPAGPNDLSAQWLAVAAWDATAAHRAAQAATRAALTRLLAKLPGPRHLHSSRRSSRSRSSPHLASANDGKWGVAGQLTLADLASERLDGSGAALAAPWATALPPYLPRSPPAPGAPAMLLLLPPWPSRQLEAVLCPPSDGGSRGGWVPGGGDFRRSSSSSSSSSSAHGERAPLAWAVECSPELLAEASKAAKRLAKPPNMRSHSGGHLGAAAAAAEVAEVASRSSTLALTVALTSLVKR